MDKKIAGLEKGKNKSQAAMEFLMTYGWAILIVVAAVIALSYSGVLSSDRFVASKCVLEPGIGCADFTVQEDSVTLVLRNGKGKDINVLSITIGNCSGTGFGSLKNGQQAQFIVTGCSNGVNEKFSEEVKLTYTGESGLEHVSVGNIEARVSSGVVEELPVSECISTGSPCLQGIENTVRIIKEIGEGALTDTMQYDVCGTDLGSMFRWNNKVYIAFGDTFGCPLLDANNNPRYLNWRSNTMAITTDTAPSDGLVFDSWILGGNGKAKQLFFKDPGASTIIPTYGVGIGNTGYLFYMQIIYWGPPGQWTCDYSSIALSTNDGQTWIKQNDIIKWNAGNFNQVAIMKIDNYLYIWGIPCGRFGSVKLMRVDQNNILSKNQYQYFTGLDDSSNPTWSNNEADAVNAVSGPIGELSVRWNEWLGRYVMMYLDESKAAVVIREGVEPWGIWSEPIIVASAANYPALYGAYMLDGYEENNGETIYFRMSQFFPLYSTYWMKTTLKKND